MKSIFQNKLTVNYKTGRLAIVPPKFLEMFQKRWKEMLNSGEACSDGWCAARNRHIKGNHQCIKKYPSINTENQKNRTSIPTPVKRFSPFSMKTAGVMGRARIHALLSRGKNSSSVPNVVNRDFHTGKPNEKWLTNITKFAIPAEKVYLSLVVDCFDGMLPY